MNPVAAPPVRAEHWESAATYYDLPSVKPSLWGGLVSSYIFLAGLGGSAQIIAAGAALTGNPELVPLVRKGRYIASGAALVGGPLLIIDLHTPQRWYNMLRIFRRTSPMSIGTYSLVAFGSLSAALAGAQFAEDRGASPGTIGQMVISLLQVPAALAGMLMSTYTGALLSSTSTPLWAAAPRQIAALFGASAMSAGAAALTIGLGRGADAEKPRRALDRVALLASAVELALSISLRNRFCEKEVDETLHETGWGAVYDFGVVVLGAGVPLLHQGARELDGSEQPPRARLLVPLMVLAGGFLLRHLLLQAGNASAKRPKEYFRFASTARPTLPRPDGWHR